MKSLQFSRLLTGTVILLVTLSFYGCGGGGGGGGKSKRPKMFTSLSAFNQFDSFGLTSEPGSQFSFATESIEFETANGIQNFISIPLPDATMDNQAIQLINSIKPFALPLITAWRMQQKNTGVLIDLSNQISDNSHQASYTFTQAGGGSSIPVIIRWDDQSASRVLLVKGLVKGVPGVGLNFISGENPDNTLSR